MINRWAIKFPDQAAPKRGIAKLLDQAEARQSQALDDLTSVEGGAVSGTAALWMSGYGDLDGLVSWVRNPDGCRLDRQRRYPVWQFTEQHRVLPGIREVVQILRSHDQWRIMRYFLGPKAQLDGLRPLDLLRAGEVERVLMHARVHLEEDTW